MAEKDLKERPSVGAARRFAFHISGRFLLILTLALVLLIAAAFLIVRQLRTERSGIYTDTAVSASASSDLSGVYTLLAYSSGGVERDYEELSAAGYDSWYLQFLPDGTGIAQIYSDQTRTFTYTADQICFADGSAMAYSYGNGQITLHDTATLIFGLAAPTVSPAEVVSAGEEIPRECRWHGTLEILKHKGVGTLENGEREVWGYNGFDAEGRSYFELFDIEDFQEGDTPILSMWTEHQGDHLVPILDTETAWYFDRWLKNSDAIYLTLYMQDGCISNSYYYRLGNESCTIRFTIYPTGQEKEK